MDGLRASFPPDAGLMGIVPRSMNSLERDGIDNILHCQHAKPVEVAFIACFQQRDSHLKWQEVLERRRNSSVLKQIHHGNPQRLGNSHQGVQGDIRAATLDFAEVLGIQIGLLSQFFLAQSALLAVAADSLANGSTMRGRHGLLRKQEPLLSRTTYKQNYLACHFLRAS